jgi:hypothetical protein
MMKTTQIQLILQHLELHNTINPMIALNEFKCFRLAARISDLRNAGYKINTDMSNGYAVYSLAV